jgi:hypothetical protein
MIEDAMVGKHDELMADLLPDVRRLSGVDDR